MLRLPPRSTRTHSFPTRRSSDLHSAIHEARPDAHCVMHLHTRDGVAVSAVEEGLLPLNQSSIIAGARSEEHTSELQSLMRISYAVFCLKKKKITDKDY